MSSRTRSSGCGDPEPLVIPTERIREWRNLHEQYVLKTKDPSTSFGMTPIVIPAPEPESIYMDCHVEYSSE